MTKVVLIMILSCDYSCIVINEIRDKYCLRNVTSKNEWHQIVLLSALDV